MLENGEAVSVDGTHLGHNLPDRAGNRYCINLVCIAGSPPAPAENGGARDTSGESGPVVRGRYSRQFGSRKFDYGPPRCAVDKKRRFLHATAFFVLDLHPVVNHKVERRKMTPSAVAPGPWEAEDVEGEHTRKTGWWAGETMEHREF